LFVVATILTELPTRGSLHITSYHLPVFVFAGTFPQTLSPTNTYVNVNLSPQQSPLLRILTLVITLSPPSIETVKDSPFLAVFAMATVPGFPSIAFSALYAFPSP